jgi:hypothetical protein
MQRNITVNITKRPGLNYRITKLVNIRRLDKRDFGLTEDLEVNSSIKDKDLDKLCMFERIKVIISN